MNFILKEKYFEQKQVKPFACLQCDKGFSRKDHLKRHMMKVHGVGEVFEVILEKENEENVDDPMELTEVPEKKNVVVTVPVSTPALSELKDKRLPKMVLTLSFIQVYSKYFQGWLHQPAARGHLQQCRVRLAAPGHPRAETAGGSDEGGAQTLPDPPLYLGQWALQQGDQGNQGGREGPAERGQ